MANEPQGTFWGCNLREHFKVGTSGNILRLQPQGTFWGWNLREHFEVGTSGNILRLQPQGTFWGWNLREHFEVGTSGNILRLEPQGTFWAWNLREHFEVATSGNILRLEPQGTFWGFNYTEALRGPTLRPERPYTEAQRAFELLCIIYAGVDGRLALKRTFYSKNRPCEKMRQRSVTVSNFCDLRVKCSMEEIFLALIPLWLFWIKIEWVL